MSRKVRRVACRCPSCGRWCKLTPAGRVAFHVRRVAADGVMVEICAGSNRLSSVR